MKFFTLGAVRMAIRSDGNVGIGKTNPSYRLDVAGNIRADLDIWMRGRLVATSDERLKTEIRHIANEKEKLYLLQGKHYKKTAQIEDNTNLDLAQEETVSERKKQTFEFYEYGYLAQELREVFPDLVSQDSEGYYGVNYIGLIPIIVEALKDQRLITETQQEDNNQLQKEVKILQDVVLSQEKDLNELREMVNKLQNVVAECCKNIGSIQQQNNPPSIPNNNQNDIQEKAVLYQNTPNPFSSNTEISCNIPTAFTGAFIYIYNLQGVELMSFPIVQTGFSTVMVSASTLSAGMYLYALIIDDQIIDSKRMILTK